MAWQDIDLDPGSVLVRRGATYADGVGMSLGPTKTRGAAGEQLLGPTVVELLRARRQMNEEDRSNLPGPWPRCEYDGEDLDLVFTTAGGTPTLRQHVDRAIRKAAERIGIDTAGLGTHAGRRSVVTNLFASGSLDLEDVARFVGHNDVATTRGYVQHEGGQPRQVSERALKLLDPQRPTTQPDTSLNKWSSDAYCVVMANGAVPTDPTEAIRRFLSGLARGLDANQLVVSIADMHPSRDTFPGEVFMTLATDALDLAGFDRLKPIHEAQLLPVHLPEVEFRGRRTDESSTPY